MKAELQELLGRGHAVLLRRSLVDITGDPNKALVLGQMIYWSSRGKSPDGWIWKSAKDLTGDFMGLYRRRMVAGLLAALVKDGWLSRRSRDNNPRKAYSYQVQAERIIDALRSRADKQITDTPVGKGNPSAGKIDHGAGKPRHPVGTTCQPYIDHSSQITPKTTEVEMDPPPSIGAEPDDNQPEPTIAGPGDGLVEDGSGIIATVELALRQAYEIVRGRLWQRLDRNVSGGQDIEAVFGPTFTIGWTKTERNFLAEMVGFCRKRWPEYPAAAAVAALIRVSFLHEGKPFQILKHWIAFNRSRPTLRTYFTLSGGQKESARRLDVLMELAASPCVRRFLSVSDSPTGIAALNG